MKVSGKMIKHMEKVPIFMQMELNMKEIGLKINNTEKELKHGKILQDMKEIM